VCLGQVMVCLKAVWRALVCPTTRMTAVRSLYLCCNACRVFVVCLAVHGMQSPLHPQCACRTWGHGLGMALTCTWPAPLRPCGGPAADQQTWGGSGWRGRASVRRWGCAGMRCSRWGTAGPHQHRAMPGVKSPMTVTWWPQHLAPLVSRSACPSGGQNRCRGQWAPPAACLSSEAAGGLAENPNPVQVDKVSRVHARECWHIPNTGAGGRRSKEGHRQNSFFCRVAGSRNDLPRPRGLWGR